MLLKLFIFFYFVLLYFHIYHCFKVNPNNDIQYIDNIALNKSQLDREILYKLPFYFQNNLINDDIDEVFAKSIKKEKASKDNGYITQYDKTYKKIKILEPNILFETKNYIYEFSKEKSKLNLHENLSFRNFYIINSGIANIKLIHPSYRDLFMVDGKVNTSKKSIDFMNKNDNFISLELHKDSILYVPNYWLVYIETKNYSETNKLIIEKIEYVPLVNKLNYLFNNVINNQLTNNKND